MSRYVRTERIVKFGSLSDLKETKKSFKFLVFLPDHILSGYELKDISEFVSPKYWQRNIVKFLYGMSNKTTNEIVKFGKRKYFMK